MFKARMKWVLLGAVGVFALIQLVPYGRAHGNPKVSQEPAWSTPEVRDLAARACFDCHSNQTRWPWYSQVAPVSWLVQRDTDEGREALNFSEWDRPQKEADDAAKELREGEMPPFIYTAIHRDAVLTAAERQALASELERLGAR